MSRTEALADAAKKEHRRVAGNLETVWEPLHEASAEELIEERAAPVDASPFPWASVNMVCRDDGGGEGAARSWHVPFAALTGGGKTVGAVNIASHLTECGHRVGYISAEMSRAQFDNRYLSVSAGVPVRGLERGKGHDPYLIRRAQAHVREVFERTGGAVYRSNRRMSRITDLDDAAKELVHGHGCRDLIIDYMQLFALDPNDASEMARISHRVRELAVELDVVTFALSQFNRGGAKEGVALHHLHGTSSLENDADLVLVVDGSKKSPAPAPMTGWDLTLRVLKNRHGPCLDLPLRFDTRTLRMTEILPDELPHAKAA